MLNLTRSTVESCIGAKERVAEKRSEGAHTPGIAAIRDERVRLPDQ
jgi:hypothetical protein